MTNRRTIILSTAIPVGVVVVALVVAVGVCLRNRKLRLFNRGITPIADEEIESWKNNERDDEKEPIPESSPPLPLPTSTSAVAPFFATATTETTAAITSPSPPPPSRHDNSRDSNHGSNDDDDIGRQVQQVHVREYPGQSSHHRQNNSSVSSVQKPPSAVIYQGSGGGSSSSSSSRSSQHNRHHRHNSSSGDRYPLNRSRSTTGGGPGTAHHPGPGTREGGPSFDPMGSTAPLVLARAPNSRPGLTDETVQGDDAFIPPVKRQSSRLSKVHHQHQHHRQRSAGVTPAAGSSSRKSSVDRKRSMSITSGTQQQQQHHMYSVSVSGGNNPPRVSVDQDDGGAHIGRAIG